MSATTPSSFRELSLCRGTNSATADLLSSSEIVAPQVTHAAVTEKKRGLDLIGLNLASSCVAPPPISPPLIPRQLVGGTFKSSKQQQQTRAELHLLEEPVAERLGKLAVLHQQEVTQRLKVSFHPELHEEVVHHRLVHQGHAEEEPLHNTLQLPQHVSRSYGVSAHQAVAISSCAALIKAL